MDSDQAENNNVMEQYTSLLQTSARLRDPDAKPVEQPEPEIVEEEVVEEIVEEQIEEPTPADPFSSLFSELEQAFVEGAEEVKPIPEPVVVPELKVDGLGGLFSELETLFGEGAEELVIEEVDEKTIVAPTISEKELEDFFLQLEGKVTEEVIDDEPIVEQVEELTEEVLEEFVPSNDPMEQYTSLLKNTKKVSNDHQGITEEASTPATIGDLKRLANNLQKSLSSLGGGGVGENDVIRIIKQYGGELGGGSGSGDTDGGSASSIYLPEQLINGGDANGE